MTTILWSNKDWAVTSWGLESLVPMIEYLIPKESLAEMWPGTNIGAWPPQIAQKGWADLDLFWPAYLKALEIHSPKGREKIDLSATMEMAIRKLHSPRVSRKTS